MKPAGAVAVMAAAVLWAAPAAAQVDGAGTFPVERSRLAMDGSGVLGVEWAAVPRPGTWNVTLALSRAGDPLILYDEVDGARTRLGALVAHRVAGQLTAAFAVRAGVQVGVALPVVLSQSADAIDTLPAAGDLGRFGLGDVRVMPKIEVARAGGFHAAVIAAFTLPTASGRDYRGDTGPSLAPELVLSRAWPGLRLAANLGYRARPNTRLINLEVGDELFARVGAGVALGEIGAPVELHASLSAATAAAAPLDASNRDHLELLAGAAVDVPGHARVLAAGGRGMSRGFGTPDWRVVLGVRWTAPAPVAGGRARHAPASPDRACAGEDPGAIEGCPELDSDGDGIPDVRDSAPGAPEDIDGFEDHDGAPDVDNDGDGVLDSVDACPMAPETANGHDDEDGCPDRAPDTDGDGVSDPDDRCPRQAEDGDGFADEDGWPDVDNDGDGVLDSADACPDQPGTMGARGC